MLKSGFFSKILVLCLKLEPLTDCVGNVDILGGNEQEVDNNFPLNTI